MVLGPYSASVEPNENPGTQQATSGLDGARAPARSARAAHGVSGVTIPQDSDRRIVLRPGNRDPFRNIRDAGIISDIIPDLV